jgi:glycosidase
MPSFNANSRGARDYLLGAAQHWIRLGLDGYRLDFALGM